LGDTTGGAGCFSDSIRQEMRVTNPDGQLANVNMSQIDALSVRQLEELDIGLVSFVHQAYPPEKRCTMQAPDETKGIKAAFLAAGIAVRERKIGNQIEYDDTSQTQKTRLTRGVCAQYHDQQQPSEYALIRHTNAQVCETLVEACRYRGLFNSEGNCISMEEVYKRNVG
jgi:hypothetical protein